MISVFTVRCTIVVSDVNDFMFYFVLFYFIFSSYFLNIFFKNTVCSMSTLPEIKTD